MPFSATINLGTVGVAITSVKLYGCTGNNGTDCTGCTVLTGYENVSVSTFPLLVSGIPNGVRYIQAEALGACSADAVKQCITISGIPGPTATPAPTNTPTPTGTSGPGATPNPTATQTPTPTPSQTSDTTPQPTQTMTPTPSQTESEATVCQYTVSGQGYPLSGSGGTNTGLIKVGGSSAIYVWAKYNSAGTSSGTASFSMTIGGVTANGGFTITSSGQVGYTNNGGTNNLHYIRLTPGTYQYTLSKIDTYSAGNNITFTWSTGTDPNSSTNMGSCLSEPPGPYLSANGTPDPTPDPTTPPLYGFFRSNPNLVSNGHCNGNQVTSAPFYSTSSTITNMLNTTVYTDTEYTIWTGGDFYYAVSSDQAFNTNSQPYYVIKVNDFGEVIDVQSIVNCTGGGNTV